MRSVPYIITIFFAAIGWSLNHFADRLLQSPIVEYRLEEKHESQNKLCTYSIKNISRDRSFYKVKFFLVFETNSKSKFLSIKPCLFPPAFLGEEKKEPKVHKDVGSFFMPEFHPNWEIKLNAKVLGDKCPCLHFSSERKEPILLLKSSVQTWVVRNEFEIIFWLIVWWFLIIIVYTNPNTENDEQMHHREIW